MPSYTRLLHVEMQEESEMKKETLWTCFKIVF